MTYTLGELAERVGGEVCGDKECLITGVASLKHAGAGDLTFYINISFRGFLESTAASAVILSQEDKDKCPVNMLVVDDPYLSYARAAQLLFPPQRHDPGIHPTAIIGEKSNIHESAWIAAHCVVGSNVTISADAVIGPGCIIEDDSVIGNACHLSANIFIGRRTHIGRRCIIQPGVVIGSDGFGYANDNGEWIRIPQRGAVVIGDDVDIGANTTIDCGALDDTIIEDGVKLDNQIQIAHNVHIGAHTAIAGCAGIAGSTVIGKRCAIGGGVGITGHLSITDDVTITATSFVHKSITRPGVYSSGAPIESNKNWRKNYSRMKQLDDMAQRLKAIEKTLAKNTEGKH